jgi:hypothetical protein
MMWSWSSNTKRFLGGPFSLNASGSNISSRLTSKNFPNTSFIAMNEAAIPPVPWRNVRREIPSFFAAESASSFSRASTCFCCRVCGSGMYSPLETICVGTGEARPSSTASAGISFASCSSLNHESASRESFG